MTSGVPRLYLFALALLVFFVAWAAVAARPWEAATPDSRAAALDRREAALRARAERTEALLAARWAAYRSAVRERNALLASLGRAQPLAVSPPVATRPVVTVTTAPPVTTTRSS